MTLDKIANVEEKNAFGLQSEEYFFNKAVRLLEQNGWYDKAAEAYANIGNYKEAAEYYLKCITNRDNTAPGNRGPEENEIDEEYRRNAAKYLITWGKANKDTSCLYRAALIARSPVTGDTDSEDPEIAHNAMFNAGLIFRKLASKSNNIDEYRHNLEWAIDANKAAGDKRGLDNLRYDLLKTFYR